ncbi:hemin uptake protein HemP [Undibacterium flavidum]|uniref:Hemin uptake protein HemP n=1 Tax=Undibacterium flavidum TaxID=2762297 RepID=A0ABR6YHD3_9BURK|nr:hemin uptake protein HemP [Undibacterium flavidum]MBC3875913.1 hemin uptake protein HemP [Undibacterium flavidum]
MNLTDKNKITQESVRHLPEIATNLRISSKDILRGHKEVEIEHNGVLYRFRCTSLGKLILTK